MCGWRDQDGLLALASDLRAKPAHYLHPRHVEDRARLPGASPWRMGMCGSMRARTTFAISSDAIQDGAKPAAPIEYARIDPLPSLTSPISACDWGGTNCAGIQPQSASSMTGRLTYAPAQYAPGISVIWPRPILGRCRNRITPRWRDDTRRSSGDFLSGSRSDGIGIKNLQNHSLQNRAEIVELFR